MYYLKVFVGSENVDMNNVTELNNFFQKHGIDVKMHYKIRVCAYEENINF